MACVRIDWFVQKSQELLSQLERQGKMNEKTLAEVKNELRSNLKDEILEESSDELKSTVNTEILYNALCNFYDLIECLTQHITKLTDEQKKGSRKA